MSFEHPVPRHLLTLIGDMTVSFAALELHMQAVLIFLVDQTARIGHILASQLSFSRLRVAILALHKEQYGENSDYLKLKESEKGSDFYNLTILPLGKRSAARAFNLNQEIWGQAFQS